MTEQMTFRHSVPVQLRFNDLDPLGHVNNSVYFTNVNANFLLPIYLHEEIEVQTTTLSIGNKSVKLLQRIVGVKNGEVKAVCETILVGFDFKSGTTKVISDEWRKAIEAYEGRSF